MAMRQARHSVVRALVCTLMIGGVCLSLDGAQLLGAAPSPPPLVLNLHFTATQPLPAATVEALTAETEAIWRPAHVQVRWVDADAQDAMQLRVVVMARLIPGNDRRTPWAVGELVTHDG